jgi:hypothetical protein
MAREKKKAKRAAHRPPKPWSLRTALKRYGQMPVASPTVIGLGPYSHDVVKSPEKPERPAMLVLIESACSPDEVRKILAEEAKRILDTKRSWTEPTRKWLEQRLYAFCDAHNYGDFQRKKSVEAVAKTALRRWCRERDKKRYG